MIKPLPMRRKRLSTVGYYASHKVKDIILGVFTAVILIGICYTILAPVIGIISLTFMSAEDLFNPMIFLVPANPTLYNILTAKDLMNFWLVLARTLGFSLGMGLLQVLIASFTGYGFARYRFLFSSIVFGIVLFTIIIPVQAYMVPLFITFRHFGPTDINLMNNHVSIFMLTATGVGLRSGLFIYIFRQFFRGVPIEINEAAFIDGAGPIRTYATVMLPNAKPAIITVLLLSMVWHYGDTVYSGILLPGVFYIHSAAAGLFEAYMRGLQPFDENLMLAQMVSYAGVVLVIVPLLTIYIILQRQFIEGIERSGIVG